jgi:hypothetical protein
MITREQIPRIVGHPVYDAQGKKIGPAKHMYLDDATGEPVWVTVRTGLFGSHETFVPTGAARLTEDHLEVPFVKEKVKGAPTVALDSEGHLSAEQERRLYGYYGLPAPEAIDAPEATGTAPGAPPAESPRPDPGMSGSEAGVGTGTGPAAGDEEPIDWSGTCGVGDTPPPTRRAATNPDERATPGPRPAPPPDAGPAADSGTWPEAGSGPGDTPGRQPAPPPDAGPAADRSTWPEAGSGPGDTPGRQPAPPPDAAGTADRSTWPEVGTGPRAGTARPDRASGPATFAVGSDGDAERLAPGAAEGGQARRTGPEGSEDKPTDRP